VPDLIRREFTAPMPGLKLIGDSQAIPLEDLPERAAAPGDPAKHQPHRILSRRRGSRVVLRHDQAGRDAGPPRL